MKKKQLISINVLIVLLEIIATIMSVKEFNLRMFTYYTQYSNVLTLISSALLIIYLIKNKVPKWLKFFRYVTVNMMTITFLIVTFVLVPLLLYSVGGKAFMMFTYGSMLFTHLLCPILLFISYCFLEKWNPISNKDKLYVLIPTIVYGVTMVLLNAFQFIDGPYPFLMVDEQPIYMSIIWFVLIFFLIYLVSFLIFKFSKKNISQSFKNKYIG